MPAMIVDPSKCTKCGVCLKACPSGIVSFGDTGLPEMDVRLASNCIECGHCALFCPASANSLSFLSAEKMVPANTLEMPSERAALNLIKTRRSIRRFKDESVPKDVIAEIFEAVRMAPTASNSQPVRWIVAHDSSLTKEIVNLILCWMREEIFKNPTSPVALLGAHMIAKAREGEDGLLRGAPHAAIAVVPKSYRWPEDGSIALTYFELAAHGMGVGACWGGFLTMAVRKFAPLREFLGIGEDEHICGAQMFGYPALEPVRQFPTRKAPDITWLEPKAAENE